MKNEKRPPSSGGRSGGMNGSRPAASRPAGSRPTANRPAGSGPAANRPAGNKSAGSRLTGNRPAGDKPYERAGSRPGEPGRRISEPAPRPLEPQRRPPEPPPRTPEPQRRPPEPPGHSPSGIPGQRPPKQGYRRKGSAIGLAGALGSLIAGVAASKASSSDDRYAYDEEYDTTSGTDYDTTETVTASARKRTVVCKYCGAPTEPDQDYCCEYCGSPLDEPGNDS